MRARLDVILRSEAFTNLLLGTVMVLVVALALAGCNGEVGVGPNGIPSGPSHHPDDPAAQGGVDGGPQRPPGQTVGNGPGDPPAPPAPGEDGGPPFVPTDPEMCTGVGYLGFDGTTLQGDREQADPAFDRDRIKPYAVLAAEYKRVLGKTPGLVGQMGSTFGADPPRWFTEPTTSAVTLFGAYRIAFQGCLTLTAMPMAFATAPNETTATTQCAAWAQRFWSRAASDEEVLACVTTAVDDTQSEPDPRRRWAYTCAAVLSSAGFLTY
jgi:hypothetical protein